MAGRVVHLQLPWAPSVNGYWRRSGNHTHISKAGRDFRKAAIADIHDQLGDYEPITGRVSVHIGLSPPDKRKRDIDNHPKGILDAIVHANLLEDDELIDRLVLERMQPEKPGAVYVTLLEIN